MVEDVADGAEIARARTGLVIRFAAMAESVDGESAGGMHRSIVAGFIWTIYNVRIVVQAVQCGTFLG